MDVIRNSPNSHGRTSKLARYTPEISVQLGAKVKILKCARSILR